LEKANLNGLKTFGFNSKIELIDFAVSKKKILIAINAHKIINSDVETREIINANIGYPDGHGAIMALKNKNIHSIKIPGCELWLDIINYLDSNTSYYLIGGKQNVIEQVVIKLKKEFVNINIINHRNGFISNIDQEADLLNDIKKHKPDVIFVAMGSPRQELLMQKIQKMHSALFLGLGGSFDVYTGNVKRAPKIWVKLNLEWAYRWLCEPKLRTKRNLDLFKFLYLLKRNKL